MLPVFLSLLASGAQAGDAGLLPASTKRIAELVFHNECAGRIACLTSWNRGEEFASLGIGHFIWYPAATSKANKPFHESFPQLLNFLRRHQVRLPPWLDNAQGCPWPDRATFLADRNSPRMRQLRQLLRDSMSEQAAFLQYRLQQALPKMLAAAPQGRRTQIESQYRRVAASPMGMYALTDYVNFKGEGTRPGERYQGMGWGLMQVLGAMHGKGSGSAAVAEFAHAADTLLTRRVANAPAGRHEARWLPGWRKRLASYVAESRAAEGY